MSSGAQRHSPVLDAEEIRDAAVDRGWTQAPNCLFFEYEPSGSIYDPHSETTGYEPTFYDSDFVAKVYLDLAPFEASISLNIGSQKGFLPKGTRASGEEVEYELTRSGLEVEADGSTDIDRALEEVEELAALLSEGSMEHAVERKDRLEFE